MKFSPTRIINLIVIIIVVFLNYSCSKDSDLLADYVVGENAGKPGSSIDLQTGTIMTFEDKMIAINILKNSQSSSKPKSTVVKKVEQPKNGKTEIKTDSTIVYTPNKDFTGKDDVVYTVEETTADNTTIKKENTIVVAVNPVLEVKDDKVATTADKKVVIPVLKNDTYADKNKATVTTTTTPAKGTVVVNNDNTLTYTPNAGATGSDTFTYTAQVENAEKTASTADQGTVAVTINPLGNLSSKLLVDEGFESSSVWGSTGTFKEDNSNASLVGNAREGSYAVKLTGAAGGARSELTIRSHKNYYEWGVEYWQGISIKVVKPVGGYRIALQHHSIPKDNKWINSAGSNSFTLTTSATDLTFWTSTDKNDVNKNPGNTAALGDQIGTTVPYKQNEWIDIVLHFKIATDNTGFYEIWMNGNKIVDIKNNPTAYAYDTGGNIKYPYDYQKIGVYYGPGSASGEIHYDSFRIWRGSGGSYEAVSPRN